MDYRTAFLYALSLLVEVEILELDLNDRVSDAAFALLNVFQGFVAPYSSQVVNNHDSRSGDPGSNPAAGMFFAAPTEESEEDLQVAWDVPKVALPPELGFIWTGTVAGQRRLDLKTVLDQVPRFAELPAQAPVNNHRSDASHRQDRKEREWQQKVLHAVRLLAFGYAKLPGQQGVGESQIVMQQLFQLLVELYLKLENSRKENSIPGCIAPPR